MFYRRRLVMAKQNNIQSIFYGKLGQVVGQRWKDKNTVRSYVIPKDPRTPAQIRSREIFRQASSLASFAMGVNFRAYMWAHPSKTEYQLRVSTANLKIRNGTDAVQALPLIPLGFAPLATYTDLAISGTDAWANVRVSSASLASVPSGRRVCLVLARKPSATAPFEFTLHFTVATGSSSDFGVDLAQLFPKPVELQCVAITSDDNENNNETYYWAYKRLV